MIAEYLMRAKGMDWANRESPAVIVNNAGIALSRLVSLGRGASVMTGPDVWWDLTGRDC